MSDVPEDTPGPRSGSANPRLRRGEEILHSHRSEGADVKTGVGSGVKWLGTGQVISQVVRIATMLVLTQLLEPAEFGVVALVTVVTGFVERVLGDTGTTAAVVRQPGLSHGLASSVFWWNVTIGGISAAVFVVFGEPIARLLGEPSAAGLVRALGLMAVISSFGHVQRALLRRRLEFRSLAIVNVSNAVVTSGATIGLAVAGWGEWALVVGNLAGTLVSISLAWILSSWRPSFIFSRHQLRTIGSFSANLSMQNVFGYISFAGDRFLIGRFIGTAELGYYGLANRLLRYPLQTSMQTYREVVFPTLARIQHDDRAMRRAYGRTLNGIAFLLLPFCLGLTALSGPMVGALLGPSWAPATDIIAIMALVGALQSLANTTGSLYLAKGRSDLSLRWQMASSAVLLASYSIGAFWGVVGVAWGFLAGIVVLFYPSFRIPLRLIDARPRDVLEPLLPTTIASIVAAAAAWSTTEAVGGGGGGDWAQLVGGTAVLGVLYGAYIVAFHPRAMRDLRDAVRRPTSSAPTT